MMEEVVNGIFDIFVDDEMGVVRGMIVLIVLVFMKTVGSVVKFVSYIAHHSRRKEKCPPINDDVLLLKAEHLAEKIRTKKLSAEKLIRSYIRRIKSVNPIVNAVVEDRFEDAIEDAKAVDKLIASCSMSENELETRYPLLGVPFTVKESLAVMGLSHNAGQIHPKRPKATADAVVVEKCRNAGAIPLLVSNTPELCMNWETFNKRTGRTRNPYDTRRSCGGSSGGEATLLSSGASIFGLGSDICGSLRMPPLFCGVWGHKPTPHVISIDGHYPSCDDLDVWKTFFCVGPLTRYASDLPLIFKVLINDEKRKELRIDEEVNVSDLNVYYMFDDQGSILTNKVSGEIVEAVKKVSEFLNEKHQCKVEKATIPKMKYSPEAGYLTLLKMDNVDHFFKKKEKACFLEFFRYIFGLSRYSFFSIAYSMLRCFTKLIPSKSYKKILEDMRYDLINILGDKGVLIYPGFTETAFYHWGILPRVFDASYMAIFNALGFPATSCTIGLNENGLPVGIQVIAAPNNDRLTMAVAKAIEAHFGGWKPPPFNNKIRV